MFSTIGYLLWLLVLIVLILVFRHDIAALFRRSRPGTNSDQETKPDSTMSELGKTQRQTKEYIPESRVDEETSGQEAGDLERETADIRRAAEVSPQMGIIKLSSVLEREIRALTGSPGQLGWSSATPVTDLFGMLTEKKYLPKQTAESLRRFWKLRGQIVQGLDIADDRISLKVLDTGLGLLRTVRSIQSQSHIVHRSGVVLFSDKECRQSLEGVDGVILETKTPAEKSTARGILPTTRLSYYQTGKGVTWEWNPSNRWGKTWYVDPDTGEKKKAWDSAIEFIGRHMEDI
jgi:hypothetical protein